MDTLVMHEDCDENATYTHVSSHTEPDLLLQQDSAFSIYYNVFNPHSILYTNTPSEFGVSIGLLKFIFEGVGITSLCIFGVIGNLLAMLVLSSPHMGPSSTSYFLRCLAISDTMVILGATIAVGIPSLLAFNPDGGKSNSTWLLFNKRIVQYSRVVSTPPIFKTGAIGFTGSVFFTMALTMDRYLAVCKPFLTRKHNLCSRKGARYVSAVLFIGAILYNLPRFWEHQYVPLVTEFDNLTAYVPVPTSFKTNFYYDALYNHWSYMLLLFVTPVIYLTVINMVIYSEIRTSRKLRKSMAPVPAKTPDTSLAYMLFGIVIVFIMCHIIPASTIFYLYASADISNHAYEPEVEFLMTFFYVLNCSVNFLIYCVSGSKFRSALVRVLTRK